MKIALVSTFPPERSGIADYTVDLARALAAEHELELFGAKSQDAPAPQLPAVQSVADLPRRAYALDRVLYQLGSHPAHGFIRPWLRRVPGIVDLHDWSLYDLTASCFIGRPAAFGLTLLADEGLASVFRGAFGLGDEPVGLPRLRQALTDGKTARGRFALNGWVFRSAQAVIVHSAHVARSVRAAAPRLPVHDIPHGVALLELGSKERARAALDLEAHDLPSDAFVVISFGRLQAHKRLKPALAAFASLAAREPRAHYVLIGPRCPECDLDAAIDAAKIRDRVRVLDGHLDEREVSRWLRAADVGINLRGPSYGGTSGTLVKMMAQELPVVVSPAPEFSHFSPDAVEFVPCDSREVEHLTEQLCALARSPERRLALGRRARQWLASAGFGWDRVARRYTDALGELA